MNNNTSNLTMINVVHILSDGTEVKVREADPEDADNLIVLIQNILSTTLFTLTTAEEFDANLESQRAWIQQYLDNPNWILLVAEVDGQLIGNLDFRNNPKLRNQHIGEFGMGIHEDYRSKGVGSALLKEFLQWAKDSPVIEKINLSVMDTNSVGVDLYQKLGFLEQGRHPKAIRFNENEYADVIEMYLFV